MPRPEYAPFITSPRGASLPMHGNTTVSSAPSAVSALGVAASETFNAALSVAKFNLHRRRRQVQTGTDSSRDNGRRLLYLERNDDDENESLDASQQHGYRGHPRLRKPEPSLSSSRSQVPPPSLGLTSSRFGGLTSVISLSTSSPSARSSSATSPSSLRDESMSSLTSDIPQSLPELSTERIEALVNFIDRSVDDAYNLSLGFGRVRWTPSRTRDGVTIHRARSGPDNTLLDAAVRGSCNVSATFREMSDLLITETTVDFAEHETAVNPSEFLDGQVLYTLVPRTSEERFVCIKYHCLRSLAPSVTKHRDYVYVELVDSFEDSDGRRIGYRLCKSVDLDAPPPRDAKNLLVHAKTLMLQTWSERAPGSLEFVTMVINDFGDRLPSWLVHKMVDTAALRSACIRDHINQRRLDMLVYAGPKELVPLSRRVCCVVCTRSFSLVRKKYNCAACGDVICSQCSVLELVTALQRLSDLSAPGGKRKTRICVKCSSKMQSRELPRRSSSARQSDSSRVSSEGSIRSSVSNGSFLARSNVSAGKIVDENRRSFLSDSTTGTSSRDSVEDKNQNCGNGSTGLRNQTPNSFQFRAMSPSVNKIERIFTSPSSPGVGENQLDVVELQPQLLSDRNLASTTRVELDLGIGKYKETNTLQPTRFERDYTAEAAELAEYSDEEEEYTGDDAGNFLHTEGHGYTALLSSQSQAIMMNMDTPTVHKVEMASFLTEEENAGLDTMSSDSDSASYLTVDENSKIVESESLSESTSYLDSVEIEELTVEEVEPLNVGIALRRSHESVELNVVENELESMCSPIRLSVEMEEVEVPVMVHKVTKKLVVGLGGRHSQESMRAPAPRPPSAKLVVDMLTTSMANSSGTLKARDAPPQIPLASQVSKEALTEGVKTSESEETLQVEALQAHLDRMNQISASLRNLREEMNSTTETPASTQTAMAALTTFESKANADRAAKIAANFISLLDWNAAPAARRAQQDLKQHVEPRTSLFNLTLAMGDGSFVDYLVDSTFEDVGESPDGTGIGWQTVISQTTGKQYFFNQNCALASWTLPGPDVFRGMLYKVL
ncbi:putative FYVE zinc finger, Zinc finger, FYVE/PHD-type, Zinc finger, RING/FYVE/PHD-type [Plasmopara halstedii]